MEQIVPNRQRVVIPTEVPHLLPPQPDEPRSFQPGTVEWNIAMVRADEAWTSLGITGEGAAVGIIDTGVA